MFSESMMWDLISSDEDVDRGTRNAKQRRDLRHRHEGLFVLVCRGCSHVEHNSLMSRGFPIRFANFCRALFEGWRPASARHPRRCASGELARMHASGQSPARLEPAFSSRICSDVAATRASPRRTFTRMGRTPVLDGTQSLRCRCACTSHSMLRPKLALTITTRSATGSTRRWLRVCERMFVRANFGRCFRSSSENAA